MVVVVREAVFTNAARPVVIVGSRRSGTTLLRTMMSQHPNLLVHPDEPQFLLELYHRFGNHITDVPAAATHLLDHPYTPQTLAPEALRASFGEDTSLSLRAFAQRYTRAWGGEALDVQRPVLKHPRLIFHLDLVFELFPDAVVVHLVRDPRANVFSQRSRWPDLSIWECALWWRDAVRAGRALARRQPDVCIELRYEDLVQQPEETSQQLCAFLQVPYTSRLLEFELETRSFRPDGRPQQVRFSRLDATRLARWREHMTPMEVRLVEACCRREMGWWGYEPLQPEVSSWRLVAWIINERARYRLREMARSTRDLLRRVTG